MKQRSRSAPDERTALAQLRELAASAFSRAAGAPLIGGNHVRLLENARENYPRWLDAIRSAKDHVHFESYFIREDDTGREFADALSAKAREGVRVRLIYDWMGNFRKASRRFWRSLRSAGVEVRSYNPPRLSSPFGWFSRDHRKMLVTDNEVGFIAGLCVGSMWVGDPARKIEPWRDTGVEIRGSAVADIERAFARIWALTGEPMRDPAATAPPAGHMNVRIVSSEPATAGMLRLDQLVAALARRKLWLTDAYYSGTASYVQALRAAAKDGVDVRLLVPSATDLPILRPFSQAGYRTLLEAGVRVFEWNGTMVHAKTAVADGQWARVGSTNLNIASWLGNCELDAVIEDVSFAAQVEEMYLRDLANTTEVVLDLRSKMRTPGRPRRGPARAGRTGGSTSRVTAGAVRIGHAIGAALTDRRVLGPVEAQLTTVTGLLLCALSVLVAIFPRALAYPAAVLGAWGGLALLWRGVKLHRLRREQPMVSSSSSPPAYLGGPTSSGVQAPAMAHRICPWWIGYFLASPVRRLWQQPRAIVGPYVTEGMTVLEPGPGMGFFTLELARLVGTVGRVIAVDAQPRMLAALRGRASRAGLAGRIETRQVTDDVLGVADLAGRVDFVLAFAMVHEVADAERFFADVSTAMKAGAKLLLSEPVGHVTESRFAATLDLAARFGLRLESRPAIRISRSAVLVKR